MNRDDIESAVQKMEWSVSDYLNVTFDRFESEAVLREFDLKDEEIDRLKRENIRLEWPLIIVVCALYAVGFKMFLNWVH